MNAHSKQKKQRPFLKWAGGKSASLEYFKPYIASGALLIEPFVGAGSVFLNSQYQQYILADINPDLIYLYQTIQKDVACFVRDAQPLFQGNCNTYARYYALRKKFNQTIDPYERAVLFLYLNRHCYNGLCRYNSNGQFNVPFGTYQSPYFPETELYQFSEKAAFATFLCQSYELTIQMANNTSLVYCDPPYAPISPTANFTAYHDKGFTTADQIALATLAYKAARDRKSTVLISNHDTLTTRGWYHQATALKQFEIRRRISRQSEGRRPVQELLALYHPE